MPTLEEIRDIRADVMKLVDGHAAMVSALEPDMHKVGEFFLAFSKVIMRCVSLGMSLTDTGISHADMSRLSEMLLDGRVGEALEMVRAPLELIERHTRPALSVVR